MDDDLEGDCPKVQLVTIDVCQLLGQTGDANEAYRNLLRDADLIFARDKVRRRTVPFYGKPLLEDIARGRQSEFDDKKGVIVELDATPDRPEVEFLFAIIEHVKGKGSCCFRPR